MNTKHTPATPLPWSAEERGLTIHRQVVVGKGLVCQVSRRAGQAENAAYIAHACNAYPRLVEALRGCLKGRSDADSPQFVLARALLVELGEK